MTIYPHTRIIVTPCCIRRITTWGITPKPPTMASKRKARRAACPWLFAIPAPANRQRPTKGKPGRTQIVRR